MSTGTSVVFQERLHVPLRWWVQATMFLASIWLAFIVALPAVVAWVAAAVLTLALATLLLAYGAARLQVGAGEFRAGRARIPVRLLTDPTPLGPEDTRRLAGVDADARAYLLLRPYLKRSIRVTVTDPADPAPYWLVCTRRPEELARALSKAAADELQNG